MPATVRLQQQRQQSRQLHNNNTMSDLAWAHQHQRKDAAKRPRRGAERRWKLKTMVDPQRPLLVVLVLLVLLQLLHPSTALDLLQMRDTKVVVDGFVDSDECWKSLDDSDQNRDGRVDSQEYVLFAQDLEPGVIDDVMSYDQLPTAFQASFTATACLCNNPLAGGDAYATNCCTGDNAHIRVPVAPSQSPNATEVNYLYTACALTSGAAEIVETTPTKTPTPPAPAPTLQPSREEDNDDELVPSQVPSPSVDRVISLIPYSIALINGQEGIKDMLWTQEYLSNLITALNVLSVAVASDRVTIIRPTGFDEVNDVPCPSNTNFDATTTLCQQVTAKVRLAVRSLEDQQRFEADLMDAIVNGALQEELDQLMWEIAGDNPVVVLDSYATEEKAGEIESDDSLSSGAIAGICIAGLFFALLPIGMYILRRHTPVEDKPPYQEYEPDIEVGSSSRDGSDPALVPAATSGSSQTNIYNASTLGAATADYGKGAVVADDAPGGFILEDDDDDDEASSSNAGSSGWSSSAGISSLNTGSMDDSADAALAAGATLAGIGVASAFSRHHKKDNTGVSDTDDGGNTSDAAAAFVSRDQLDQLIEAGDWAAVGATAALLAAASDSQSAQSLPRSGSMRSHQSADAARAAELDQLVDAGDWEGVVAAAAKFEAQADSGTHSSKSRTDSGASAASSASGTGSGTGTGTGSGTGTGTSMDSPGKMQKREEVRSEVEALVRRVVPEEIGNVDEMMNQFKGREEELVETLRTMQERAVAQKARQAGQKSAKLEARRSVQRGVVPGTSGVVGKVASLEIKEAALGHGGGSAAGAGMTKPLSPKSSEQTRTAMNQAMAQGDWDKVGETARVMQSGAAEGFAPSSEQTHDRSGPNAPRMAELDNLIEQGDWTQVVNLANRYSGEEKSRKISQEEEDALKEAELWTKIAEQKKAAGATDAAASDAAEWAIQRSLSQLKEAERKSEKKGSGNNDEDEV